MSSDTDKRGHLATKSDIVRDKLSYPSLVESHKSWLGSNTSLWSKSSGSTSNTTMPGVFTDGARITSPSVLWELPSPFALEDEAMSKFVSFVTVRVFAASGTRSA